MGSNIGLYIILGVVLLVILGLGTKNKVPEHLKGIPKLNFYEIIFSLITGKSFIERYNKLVKPKLDRMGCAVFQRRGKWGLTLTDALHHKEVYNKSNIFLKKNPDENLDMLLSNQFFGKSNLLFSDNIDWKRHRRIVNPAFKISWDINFFSKGALELITKIEASPKIDIHEELVLLTLDALGRGLLNYEFNALSKGTDFNLKLYQDLMKAVGNPIFFMFPILEKIIPSRKKFFKLNHQFRDFLKEVIEKKKMELDDNKNDLISLMLMNSTQDVEDPLSMDEMISNLVIFFLAGHETTASALTSCLYYLGKNTDIQDKARREVEEIIGKKEFSIPTFDEQKNMKYLTNVIKESMRIVTSINEVRRYCNEDHTFYDGLKVKKGNFVVLQAWYLNHNEKYFPNPNIFDPERYSDPDQVSNWLSFGTGTRSCVGTSFSLIEQRVVLSMLLLKFDIKLGPTSRLWEQPKLAVKGLVCIKDLDLIFTSRN
ncbi:cytochrome P450 [Neoconidiobolus thromboides FSU 785]|nr:cytochrome P450 [Neoconidiobolus thromboides FSU 785]